MSTNYESAVRVTWEGQEAEQGVSRLHEKLSAKGVWNDAMGNTRGLKGMVQELGIAHGGAAREITMLVQALGTGNLTAGAATLGFIALSAAITSYEQDIENAKKLTEEFKKTVGEMFKAFGEQKGFERLGDKLSSPESKSKNFEDQEKSIDKQIETAEKKMDQFSDEMEKKYGKGWGSLIGKAGEWFGFNAEDSELAKEITTITARLEDLRKEKERVSKQRIGEEMNAADARSNLAEQLNITAPAMSVETGLPEEKVRQYEAKLHKAEEDAAKRRDERIKSGWKVPDADQQRERELNDERGNIEREKNDAIAQERKKQQEARERALKQFERIGEVNEQLDALHDPNFDKDLFKLRQEYAGKFKQLNDMLSNEALTAAEKQQIDETINRLKGEEEQQARKVLASRGELDKAKANLTANESELASKEHDLQKLKVNPSSVESFNAWRTKSLTSTVDAMNPVQTQNELLKEQVSQLKELVAQGRKAEQKAQQDFTNAATVEIK